MWPKYPGVRGGAPVGTALTIRLPVKLRPESPCAPPSAGYNPQSFAQIPGAAMPKRTDIKSIMIIGAGPIVI